MAGLPGQYPMETVERAEELWCVDGLTMGDVAARVGVAVSTVKRWAEKYGWHAKREEIRQALASIRVNTIRLRAKLIENTIATLDPMSAFAVAKIEDVTLKAQALAEKGQTAATPAKLRDIRTDEDAVAALEEAVEIRLNDMLANPGQVCLKSVRDLSDALKLVKDMRAASKPSEAKRRGISAESADALRREILGVRE